MHYTSSKIDIMEEKQLWTGAPSQWVNLTFYIWCIPLSIVFGLGLLMALWKYYQTKLNKLLVTDQRIIEERGIFSKVTDEIELYRVKDITYEQPFWLRIFGLSNIILTTADHSSPTFVIKAIKNGKHLKEQLRIAIDIRRDLKRVRELDFN